MYPFGKERIPSIFERIQNLDGDDDRDAKRTLSINEKKIVYTRDKGRCQVCDEKVPFEQAEFGHDRAHSRGGRTTIRNCLTLHPHCNMLMRTKSLAKIRQEIKRPKSKKEKTKKKRRKSHRQYSDSPFDFELPQIEIPRF